MTVRSPRPQDINRGARHTLFVEGRFDAVVLTTFFQAHPLSVELHVAPFGPSFSNRAAAEALFRHHPEYYFLIDRDHCDDAEVEKSWKNFPDPNTKNILIWRRRELENYFLIPEYLLRSAHLAVTETELRDCIREACQRRLYLDVANHVLVEIREGFKRAWIELFQKPDEFPTREAALQRLHALDALTRRRDDFTASITPAALEQRLDRILTEFTGPHLALSDAHDLWRSRLCGKEVLTFVIQRCFRIRSAQGKLLDGDDRQREVARALVKLPLEQQPDDLRALHQLLDTRLRPEAA